jgi:biopolymer transport protein ExbB
LCSLALPAEGGIVVTSLVDVTGLLAQAGDAAGAAQAASAIEVQSIWDFMVKGGPMMIPIGVASFIALAIVIERLVSLTRHRVAPAKLLPRLEELLFKPDRDTEAALEHCRRDGSSLANILAVAIKRLGDPIERIEKYVQEAGQREVFKLRKYLRPLALVASVAPLMGLLGTTFGMIRAFQTVATSAEALGRTELLAKGIYEAMITTAAGLSVAIPVLIGYHWIAAKVQRLVAEIDQKTMDFIEAYQDRARAEVGVGAGGEGGTGTAGDDGSSGGSAEGSQKSAGGSSAPVARLAPVDEEAGADEGQAAATSATSR